MNCPECHQSETRVVDSREDESAIRRRRECLKCQFRFTTFERIEVTQLLVIKRDGRREPYLRKKLIAGIKKAGKKRPIVLEKIETIANKIEREIYDQCRGEVKSSLIGQKILHELQKIDPIAYLRFVSVHRSFNDLQAFEKELIKIMKTNSQ